MDYTIHLSNQLRPQLRALRKARGLTQAALGQRLGISQARVAEIENNPGVVSLDQLVLVLSALQASLLMRDNGAVAVAAATESVTSTEPPAQALHAATAQGTAKRAKAAKTTKTTGKAQSTRSPSKPAQDGKTVPAIAAPLRIPGKTGIW